jgi:hypothetical protein
VTDFVLKERLPARIFYEMQLALYILVLTVRACRVQMTAKAELWK